MKTTRLVTGVLTAVLAGGACLSAAGAAQAAPRPGQDRPYQQVTSSTYARTYLTAVSADSASDAWAVGSWVNSLGRRLTLILHWNGSTWTRVNSPSPSPSRSERYGNYLTGVTADSPTDAWAVGYVRYCDCSKRPLILHWNGAKWSQVTAPNPGGKAGTQPSSVTALSPTDAWIAGYYVTNTGRSLVLQWNGSTWAEVPSPNPGGTNGTELSAVGADSATDAWAVGHYYSDPYYYPMILHWNGSAWSQVASPGSMGVATNLTGVSADSATDAWAVGLDGSGPLIAHWDGSAWSQVASPDPGSSAALSGVSAVSASHAWAVGEYGGYDAQQAIVLQWDGSAWTQAATPTPKGWVTGDLAGVSADSATDAWAVGDYSTAQDVYSFILHWNGTAWTKVTSPSP